MADGFEQRGETFNKENFDRFLVSLDEDRERAGEKYEALRRKLVKFFQWRGSLTPEDHADETINRVVRRIAGGEVVQDINKYFYGVARLVVLEMIKERERQRAALDQMPQPEPVEAPDAGPQVEYFRHCLNELPADQRALIIEYYLGEKREKIENRQKLAQKLGIPLNALRIRAHRIREKLEACVKKCQGE